MSPKEGARLLARQSDFGHPKCALSNFIFGHPLNQAVSILYPQINNEKTPTEQENSSSTFEGQIEKAPICGSETAQFGPRTDHTSHKSRPDHAFEAIAQRLRSREYTAVRCNLACLVEHDFVERHIRGEAASFCAQSVGTLIDGGDSAAVLPDGKLHLAVSEATYQRLGLQGARVPHNPGAL